MNQRCFSSLAIHGISGPWRGKFGASVAAVRPSAYILSAKYGALLTRPQGYAHMALEIERKFLVRGDGWRRHVVRTRRLRQAYLSKNDRISMRVRIDGDEAATLTIKAARTGIARQEYEYAVPVADAKELLELREGAIISKTRHIVRNGGLNWEIDVFDGDNAGLVIAEIELDRADRIIELPYWIGEEVTDDRRYYNADLAKHPFSSWVRAAE